MKKIFTFLFVSAFVFMAQAQYLAPDTLFKADPNSGYGWKTATVADLDLVIDEDFSDWPQNHSHTNVDNSTKARCAAASYSDWTQEITLLGGTKANIVLVKCASAPAGLGQYKIECDPVLGGSVAINYINGAILDPEDGGPLSVGFLEVGRSSSNGSSPAVHSTVTLPAIKGAKIIQYAYSSLGGNKRGVKLERSIDGGTTWTVVRNSPNSALAWAITDAGTGQNSAVLDDDPTADPPKVRNRFLNGYVCSGAGIYIEDVVGDGIETVMLRFTINDAAGTSAQDYRLHDLKVYAAKSGTAEKKKIAYVTKYADAAAIAAATDGVADATVLAKLCETYDVDIIVAAATADASKPASTFDAYDAVVLSALPGSANVPSCLKGIDKPLVTIKPFMFNSWAWGTPANIEAKGSPVALANVPTGVSVTQSTHPIFNGVTLSDGKVQLADNSSNAALRVLTPVIAWAGDNEASVIPLATIPTGTFNYATNPQNLTDIAGKPVIFEIMVGSTMTSTTITKKTIHIGVSDVARELTPSFFTILENAIEYVMGSFTFTGIDKPKTNDSKVIVNKMYFDMLGRQMPENAKGLLIEKVIYEDGSHSASKMFIK